MFCKKCGAPIAEGNAFCVACGAKVETEPAPAEPVAAPVEPVAAPAEPAPASAEPVAAPAETVAPIAPAVQPEYAAATCEYAPAPKKSKAKLFAVLGAVAVCAAVVIALFATGIIGGKGGKGGSYTDVAIGYAKATEVGDIMGAIDYCAPDIMACMKDVYTGIAEEQDMTLDEFFEMLAEDYEEEFDEKVTIKSMEDFFKLQKEVAADELKEEFGKYKIEASVDKDAVEELSKSEIEETIEEIADELDSYYELDLNDYLDVDKITKGYNVTVEGEIVGEDDSYEFTTDVIIVKYNGKWKALNVF